jgi:uncharacterized protein (DUF488 family)
VTYFPGLLSVGYEGRTAQSLVQLLVDAGVDVVVDVRLTPLSRKPGLSKTRLSELLADVGVEYRHLRALGNPRENRAPFGDCRVALGVRRFRRLLEQPASSADLEELAELARPVAWRSSVLNETTIDAVGRS